MRRAFRFPPLAAGAFLAGLLLASGAASATGDESRLLSFVRDWSEAWQAQELEAYLAFYSSDARVGRRGRAAHESHKASVFARGEQLELELGDAEWGEAVLSGETLLSVSFLQHYRSPSLEDLGRKQLLLRSSSLGLRIVRETWKPASGPIQVALGAQLAAAVAPAASPPPLSAADEGAVVVAQAAPGAAGVRDTPAADEGLQPLLGEGYAPPAAAVDAGAAASDLLAIEPLLRDEAPVFLKPVSFRGLPGDIDPRIMVEEVVARINGRVLTRSAFIERLEGQHLQLLLADAPDLQRRLELIVSETLMQTVERWLLVQEAEVNRAEVESFWRQRLLELRKQVEAETVEDLQELLAAEGMTLTTLREQFVANEVVQQRVTTRIDRSETRLREYYQQHGSDYAEPARVTLRQILVPVADPSDLARAESALDQALAQLADGADWCDVHAVYGQGASCGELGELDLDDLLPEMREVAAGLPIDAVSKPVRSSAGLHLVQVRARSEVSVPPFDDVAAEIERKVIDLEFNRLLEDYLTSLKETAAIEINPRYGTLWEAPGVGQ